MRNFEDLTKEELIEMLHFTVDLGMAVDGLWFLAAEKAHGFDKALELDVEVWENYAALATKRIRKRFNIQSEGLAAVKEVMAYDPYYSTMKMEFVEEEPDKMILNVVKCQGLETLERMGREILTCEPVETAYMRKLAQTIDPRISVRALKLPPRKSPDDLCCQWLFTRK